MDFENLIKEYTTSKFIATYITTFIILFTIISFIKLIGSLPMLLIITFIVSYYINKMNMKKIEKFTSFGSI